MIAVPAQRARVITVVNRRGHDFAKDRVEVSTFLRAEFRQQIVDHGVALAEGLPVLLTTPPSQHQLRLPGIDGTRRTTADDAGIHQSVNHPHSR